jgi:hypothetical protein
MYRVPQWDVTQVNLPEAKANLNWSKMSLPSAVIWLAGWLTDWVGGKSGRDAILPPCNFSRQTSKTPRFSRVSKERKKERNFLYETLLDSVKFGWWLLCLSHCSVFLSLLPTSLQFILAVMSFFYSLLYCLCFLLYMGLHVRAQQWTEICPACTDSCRNKFTLVSVKELSWQRVTNMFTRKRN